MEIILCAAIWLKDYEKTRATCRNLDRGVVLCGWRHHTIIGQVVMLTGKRLPEFDYEHGFITNLNRFVTREEALEIATEAGQLNDRQHHPYDLFSEDLY